MSFKPLPQQHGIHFLRENELVLLHALVQRSDYGKNITKLSEYQDLGSHPGAMRMAAYVLKELGNLQIVQRDCHLWLRLNFVYARDASEALKGVKYGFTPAERDIVALTTLSMRYDRSINKEDARSILCTRGSSLRFYMRKKKVMNYSAGDNREYYYYTTPLGVH